METATLTSWTDEDGRVHVRNSERGTLDRCPQQWWWGWRDGLRAKETAQPLWFGTAIHEALAARYKKGTRRLSLARTIDVFNASADMEAEYIKAEVGLPDEEAWVAARELGESMLREYVGFYGKDEHWDVIATEQSFEIAVEYRWTEDNAWLKKRMRLCGIATDWFYINGTFDGVYRDLLDNKVKLMEHKTAKSISVGHLPMDNQAGTYWMVAQDVGRDQGWLGPKERIHEITYNFLRKAMPDGRPRDEEGYATNKPIKAHYIDALTEHYELTGKETLDTLKTLAEEQNLVVLGDRSMVQPSPLFERHPVRKTNAARKGQLHRMHQEVLRMNALITGSLEVTKAPSRDSCSWCPFKEMCELHESGHGWTEYRDAMFRSIDPYADHRKSASA